MMLDMNMQTPAPAELREATGIMTGSRVATRAGWCAVENVMPGTEVLTFDDGFREVRAVSSAPFWEARTVCPRHLWPLNVPAGVLGNRDTLFLMPDQTILVETDTAEDLFGDPFQLIPVRALEGARGIAPSAPPVGATVTTLRFDDDQILFANSGAMYLCGSIRGVLDVAFSDHVPEHDYTVLSMEDAQRLVAALPR